MMNLLTIREAMKTFFQKYDRYTTPLFKFVGALLLFLSLNKLFGYSDLMGSFVILFGLSVVCAFLSEALTILIAGVVTLVNLYSVSIEVAAVYLVLFLLIYFLYIRFFPKCGWIIMYTPVLYIVHLHYALPIILGMFLGPVCIVPLASGVILYYFSQYVGELSKLLATTTGDDTITGYTYLIEGLLSDKTMMVTIMVFTVVIMASYIVYRLKIDYAAYIAAVVGGILGIVLFLMCGFMLEASTSILGIILGCLVGTVAALIVQFAKGILDYSRIEQVQFEDDDYYYYVKAVPKMQVQAENINVKKINSRVKNKN